MTNVKLAFKNEKPFNWYVWNNGKKDKFYNRKIAISYMQLTDGLLVNMNIKFNPKTIKK